MFSLARRGGLAMISLGITLAAVLWLGAVIAFFARRTPGYRHARDTISELGAAGAPCAVQVAWFGFAPIALLMAVAALSLPAQAGAARALALCIATGYGVAALFPCDRGAPLSGSARNAVHNLGGVLQYV